MQNTQDVSLCVVLFSIYFRPKADRQVLPFQETSYYLAELKTMTDCCSMTSHRLAPPKRYRCPVNGQEYARVSVKTVLHHIAKPWQRDLRQQGYYFCDDQNCNVVYFGQDNSIIQKEELKLQVGVKEQSLDSLVCYCFDVTKSEAVRTPMTKEFVTAKTREGACSCETSNPSGRCCLKDFPAE